jgi:hypothetical protein
VVEHRPEANLPTKLLTSDWPIDMPLGLADPKRASQLPVSPHILFVAAHNNDMADALRAAKLTEVARRPGVTNKKPLENFTPLERSIVNLLRPSAADGTETIRPAGAVMRVGDRPVPRVCTVGKPEKRQHSHQFGRHLGNPNSIRLLSFAGFIG